MIKGHASTYFDDEGVEVFDNTLVDQGILNRYLLSNYSAKKLNLSTTGNAGGTHNLIFEHHNISLEQMIKDIKKFSYYRTAWTWDKYGKR